MYVPKEWMPFLVDEVEGNPYDSEVNSLLLKTCPDDCYLYDISIPITESGTEKDVKVYFIYKPLLQTIKIF